MLPSGIACTNCGLPYPESGLPHHCQKCGGLFDYGSIPKYDPLKIESNLPGIWRFRHTFGLPLEADFVSLGEGNTPLVPARVNGRDVFFKCEYQNPTGSFKDRGSSLIATWLIARRISEAVEDSSGNAGASFAYYASRAKINAHIYIPEHASGPKRRQIESSGAELIAVRGSRKDVTIAAEGAAGKKVGYASHAALPFNLPGYATTAYEIYEQLGGKFPGSVILPVGQGGYLLGISRGFKSLMKSFEGIPPILIGVQARACAPLWGMYTSGREAMGLIAENPSIAEGVVVRSPLRGDKVLHEVASTGGMFFAVDEGEILPARDDLARMGFYVEPTSALTWSALVQCIDNIPDPIVVLLTGSGLKY